MRLLLLTLHIYANDITNMLRSYYHNVSRLVISRHRRHRRPTPNNTLHLHRNQNKKMV